MIRRAQPEESREVRAWIIKHHYTQSAPPGYRVALEFIEGKERVGAMLLGRPTSRELDPDLWLELTRMYFVDSAPKNTESKALAMMRKYVRIWMPEIKGLLSYSDGGVGHLGTVYLADNWAPFGRTKLNTIGWKSRPNRRTTEVPSRKTRWIRTP